MIGFYIGGICVLLDPSIILPFGYKIPDYTARKLHFSGTPIQITVQYGLIRLTVISGMSGDFPTHFKRCDIAIHLKETTQAAQSSLDVNHAARSIRFAPVLVLPFQAVCLGPVCIVLHGGG